MADVNRTPFNIVPEQWAFDIAVGPFIQELLQEIDQLRTRTGGDLDLSGVPLDGAILHTGSTVPDGFQIADGTGGAPTIAAYGGFDWIVRMD